MTLEEAKTVAVMGANAPAGQILPALDTLFEALRKHETAGLVPQSDYNALAEQGKRLEDIAEARRLRILELETKVSEFQERHFALSVKVPDRVTGLALVDVLREFENASKSNPKHSSAHEGWAVLREEVDELWDEVKVKESKRDHAKMRREAVQVAAMALRFLLDCCPAEPVGDRGR